MNKKKTQGSLMFKNSEPTNPCQQCKIKQGTIKKHSCVYASEINQDSDFRCNCCLSCQGRCCEEV